MSIKTEITRLQNAKASIKTAIEGKGVTVPDGTKLDGMAALVDSISSGGGSSSETWVLNLSGILTSTFTGISFVSNGGTFSSITIGRSGPMAFLRYDSTNVCGGSRYTDDNDIPGIAWEGAAWVNKAYRKLTFSTPPSGDLLTWLEANAVKQANDTAVQTDKAITITSNGTTEITPDAPYDALSSVDVTVNVSGGGGGGASANWNDVTFIDYDGSVLYSYSLAEAQTLTELPALPSHEGLVCQGWNWTLEAIKALNRPVTVGAMYITDDGATRLHIWIATVGRMTVPLYIGQTVSNGVSIDWGDGSTTQTLSGTASVHTSHTYAEPGDYVISLMPKDGCTLSFGIGSSSYCVMGSTGNNGIVYSNMLQDVSIGKNVTSIGHSTFKNCYSLTSITMPDGVTSIASYAFQSCYSLASIIIPTGVTSIGNDSLKNCHSLASIAIPDGVTSIIGYALQNCYSLARITIPAEVTYIGDNAFQSCYSLASIIIPTGVTSIDNYAFSHCYGMRYYDFSAFTAIPALSNKNAFNNIPSDCQMLIPSALYNNWKTATNWATYASKMVSV